MTAVTSVIPNSKFLRWPGTDAASKTLVVHSED